MQSQNMYNVTVCTGSMKISDAVGAITYNKDIYTAS